MAGKGQRKGAQLAVPELAEDAAERKRVLNVLAQRRYRKRKREQVAALKAQLKENNRDPSESGSTTTDSTQHHGTASGAACSSDNTSEPLDAEVSLESNMEGITPASPRTICQLQEAIRETLGSALSDSNSQPGFVNPEDLQPFSSFVSSPPSISASQFASLPSLPSLDSSEPTDDLSSPLTFRFLGNTMTLDQLPTGDLSSTLQLSESSTFSFPDDHHLEVPSLTLLRAMLTVARRLNLTSYIWDPNGISPFYTGPGGPELSNGTKSAQATQPGFGSSSFGSGNSHLSGLSIPEEDFPPHLWPTQTQRLIPHHAVLDLFPWPTTRDKLIQVFSVPAEFRPPAAADPMGLVGLIYDVENEAEGMRINGADPFVPEMWEVGQHVFQRWWWAFETSIVEQSNYLRRERGQQGLVLGSAD